MTQERKSRVLTLAVLLAALSMSLVWKAGWRPADLKFARAAFQPAAEQDPRDAIYAMLNAARAGDVKAYLAGHTGPMEAELRQLLAESTEAGFAKYLQDSNAAIKGVALSDPQSANLEAVVRVEYVYQDRDEVQLIHLEKVPAGWKISRADSGELVKTLIPYGTPVK